MKDEIKRYVSETLLDGEEQLADDTRLYSGGLLTSMAHIKLVNFLERTYNVSIPLAEIRLTNFDSVEQIAAFVQERIGR